MKLKMKTNSEMLHTVVSEQLSFTRNNIWSRCIVVRVETAKTRSPVPEISLYEIEYSQS